LNPLACIDRIPHHKQRQLVHLLIRKPPPLVMLPRLEIHGLVYAIGMDLVADFPVCGPDGAPVTHR
jgi:hypothetical protein